MLSLIDKTAVKAFLNISKDLIRKKRCKLIPRTYNINGKKINYKNAIIDIGIVNIDMIWKYVLELKTDDCFRISHDMNLARDSNSEIFEFIKKINDNKVYIKLTLRNCGKDTIICLSFHRSDR